MGFSRPECWCCLPFPSLVDHILSQFSTMTCSSWMAQMMWLIKLHKVVIEVIILVSFLIVVFILSALWWMRKRGLCKLPDQRDWLWGKLHLALVGRARLSKSLIHFSVYGWSSSLASGQTMVGAIVTSSKKIYASTSCLPGPLLSVTLTFW